MSESIWFEEVDTAFISLLKSIIKIEGKTVKVKVRKPDEDFNEEDYPLITIYNVSDKFSRNRYNPESVVVHRDNNNNTAIVEESALPYDLLYQIDFWSTLQSDMNLMTKLWKSYSNFWFNLQAVDQSGTERSCFVLSQNDFSKSDLMSNGKRLFHSFGTYKVQVELDENVQRVVPMVVQKPDIDIKDL